MRRARGLRLFGARAIDGAAAATAVRARREQFGWTREALAPATGTTARFIARLEADEEDWGVLEPSFVRGLARLLRLRFVRRPR